MKKLQQKERKKRLEMRLALKSVLLLEVGRKIYVLGFCFSQHGERIGYIISSCDKNCSISIQWNAYYSAIKRSELSMHITTWMNFKTIMPIERSQTERSHTIYISLHIKFQEVQTNLLRDKEDQWGWRQREVMRCNRL